MLQCQPQNARVEGCRLRWDGTTVSTVMKKLHLAGRCAWRLNAEMRTHGAQTHGAPLGGKGGYKPALAAHEAQVVRPHPQRRQHDRQTHCRDPQVQPREVHLRSRRSGVVGLTATLVSNRPQQECMLHTKISIDTWHLEVQLDG